MGLLHQLCRNYDHKDCRGIGSRELEQLKNGLKDVKPEEITTATSGRDYIVLLRKFREAVAENDKLHGDKYPHLLNSLLSVGEDGLYSNNLRFIFELIQNVDDCDFPDPSDCELDMRFDFNNGLIVLTYNELGFTPYNAFAITGIAEAAKNISSQKNEIGEKGIGLKSVFGVADKVLIESGWFSFELHKENFTIPISSGDSVNFAKGTRMTLYVASATARTIYKQLKEQYCKKEALFSKNPLLFLNKLTKLKIYFDSWRSMEFTVSRALSGNSEKISREDNVYISASLHDYDNGSETNVEEKIICVRYTYPVTYSHKACQSRYGENTALGSNGGKKMLLQVVVPYPDFVSEVGHGALYSFLPTQIRLKVPMVCHVPFKLDASREFVDPQNDNLWFAESCEYLRQLLDYVYTDWCKLAKSDIVWYLCDRSQSLFNKTNEKVSCLSQRAAFIGQRYLDMPIFYTGNTSFHSASEVLVVNQDETNDPELVYLLLGCKVRCLSICSFLE